MRLRKALIVKLERQEHQSQAGIERERVGTQASSRLVSR